MIDTVIFDLGKVLVDFKPVEGMIQMGFTKEAITDIYTKIFKGPWLECDKKIHTLYSIKKYFLEYAPEYEKEIDTLFEKLPLLTGTKSFTKDLLKDLKRRGYKLYVLSNYGNIAFEINKSVYDFLDYFDGILISYQVGMIKPHLDIYKCLINKYSIDPKTSVFIDDSIENVNAAKLLGMEGIHFKDENSIQDLYSLLKKN